MFLNRDKKFTARDGRKVKKPCHVAFFLRNDGEQYARQLRVTSGILN